MSDLREELQPKRSADAYVEARRLRDHLSEEESSTEFVELKLRITEAVGRFNAKDRDIILTSFRHQDLETGDFVLPEEERDRLCREWHFNSPNALTQYRKRKISELRRILCA